MNLATVLALLSLTLTDPTGDAIGDGTLNPPTSPIYANSALFDLQAVELEVSEGGVAVLKVTMGALSATAPQPSAAPAPDAAAPEDGPTAVAEQAAATREPGLEPFDVSGLLAVIDVYLDTAAGGATRTLSGPDMLMPLGVGWDHAVRLSAAGAQGVSYVGSGAAAPEAASRLPSAEPVTLPADPEAAPTAAGDGAAPGATQEAAPAPEELLYVPLTVDRRGNVLEIRLPWSLDPESHVDLYAMTGVHDPFSTDGWRRLADAPSPWAFSGSAQVTPVIDLLASDADAQADALRRGVLPLPPREPGMSLPLSPWLWMMIGGVALALIGLVMRGRVARLPGADDAGAGGEGEVAVVEPPAGDAHERDEREPADEPRDAPPAGPDRAPGEEPTRVPSEDGPREEPRHAPSDQLPLEEPTEAPSEELPTDPGDEAHVDPDAAAAAGPTPGVPAAPGAELGATGGAEPDASPGTDPAATSEPLEARALSTSVEETFLADEPELGFGDGAVEGDESFWHPGSRGRKTVTPAEPEEL